jgi:hypothetical protein
MSINKPLIVFGRDEIETYQLLNAIANRRERELRKRERINKIKSLLLSYLSKVGLRWEGGDP